MQLTLDLALRDGASFDNYIDGSNDEVVAALKQFVITDQDQYLYCFGPAKVGCSHLLQACCQLAGHSQRPALYVPLKEFIAHDPAILLGLESLTLVCVDDIEAIAGRAEWEEAVFDLFNRLQASGTKLIVAGHVPVNELPLALADLSSRLAWGAAYQIKPVSDDEKPRLLAQWATQRGFQLSGEAISYILNHYPRDMKSLQKIMQSLDSASLERQQRITIPFIKTTLA